mmetsp:Transcript_87929/g.273183  ORF Transcript_87929/g.273183 Transcript_87929/m.273183 type:complete len:348 (-) Transcript_87929:97-1140(-)
MAKAPVLGPTPHEQDELPGARVQTPTLGDQRRVVQGHGGVHEEVHGHILALTRRDEDDLGFVPLEGRAPELECATANEAVCARADRRLLELPGIQLCRSGVAGPTGLQAPLERCWAGVDHDIHLGHCDAEGRAVREAASCKGHDFRLREHWTDNGLDSYRDLCHRGLRLRGRCNLAKELSHLRLPTHTAECWGHHRHRTGSADFGLSSPWSRRRRCLRAGAVGFTSACNAKRSAALEPSAVCNHARPAAPLRSPPRCALLQLSCLPSWYLPPAGLQLLQQQVTEDTTQQGDQMGQVKGQDGNEDGGKEEPCIPLLVLRNAHMEAAQKLLECVARRNTCGTELHTEHG